MDPKKAKSQIADQLKNAGSVLVTTNSSPSIDELSATIGLTHLLLAMKKHATAVVSSDIPSSLKFLGTDENVETSTDRMRDFVLSFDKEKADKFRYKLVDDQVKIFITPYKTVITKDDFNFTQGDFNIDAIVVIGATNREELDDAILEHGRILHEAEVLTINAGSNQKPSIGSVNWIDEEATSVSEMLVSISEALGSDLLNKDSAQSFLTGIIDSTQMFSSSTTSPKVMTMAAQLMAAGADQHKIIEELKVPEPEPQVSMPADKPDESTEDADEQPEEQKPEEPKKEDGVSVDLSKTHEKQNQVQSPPQPAAPAPTEPAPAEKAQPNPQPVTPAPVQATPPPPPPPQESKAPAVDKPQDNQSSHGGYLQGDGPSGAGGASVNSTNQSSSSSQKVFSHPPAQQSDKSADDEPHINVHPELPTMKAQHKTITPPPPPKPIQTLEEKAQAQHKQPQPTAPKSPQSPEQPQQTQQTPQSPQPAQKSDSTEGEGDIDSARKAVEQAIASSPPPAPTPRQDTSAKPPEQGGDIVIDHEGNIQNQDPGQN